MEEDIYKYEKEEEDDELTKKLVIGEELDLKESRALSQNSQDLSIENMPDNPMNYDKSIKVIILGDSNVGKSSIVNCLQQDTTLQRKTISLEHYNYTIKINKFILRMQIWDTVGQEKFDSITTNYYRTTDVAILVYAINDINSFNNITRWDEELNDKGYINSENDSNMKSMIKVLVGNKKDLEKERKVSYEQGVKLCEEKDFNFFEEINCKYYKEGIFDESSSYISNKEQKIEMNKDNDDKNDDNDKDENNNEDDKDCVKDLFERIGKIIYKQYLKEQNNRQNSTNYVYEASASILEGKDEEEEEDKSCCC